MSDDLYERLGVARDAEAKEIKAAYRRLARKHHPDVNPGDPEAEERFKAISAAYKILSDPQKRSLYDRHGMAAFKPGGAASAAGVDISDLEDLFQHLGFDDIFSSFFGAGPRRRGHSRDARARGEDVVLRVALDLEGVVEGLERRQRVRVQVPCEACGAGGVAPGSTPRACSRCRGSGRLRRSMGFLQVQTDCPDCGGAGRLSDPCRKCRGEGRVAGDREVAFKVPPGVRHGAKIRYQGRGDAGRRGGPAGHLYVLVEVKPHRLFRREGDDLLVSAHLTLPELLLGTTLSVDTVGGATAKVKVPQGSRDGDEVRVRGAGLPGMRGGRGDLCVHLAAERSRVSPRAKALLQDLADALPGIRKRFTKP